MYTQRQGKTYHAEAAVYEHSGAGGGGGGGIKEGQELRRRRAS
jgi:hypothetical protein